MELEGKVWKSGKFWLIDAPAIDALTQGSTREEAIEMMRDLVMEMVLHYFESEMDSAFNVTVNEYDKGFIGVTSSDNNLLLALSLRKQREKSGSTVREAAERLGAKSPNGYAQYEKGRIRFTLDQYEKLLQAANPFHHSLLRIV